MPEQYLQATPLCVDLDGTLVRGDLAMEALLNLGKRAPWQLARLLPKLLQGRAAFKLALAEIAPCDPEVLPYNDEVLALVRQARIQGRKTVLVSASPRRWVEAVAWHLDLFDEILATEEAGTNLAGSSKASQLVACYGKERFDYAGNAHVDLHVWRESREAIVVTPNPGVITRLQALRPINTVIDDRPARLKTWIRAIRLHQWAKNLLIFVPLLAAHAWQNSQDSGRALLAFLVFGLTASSVYVLNDLLDLEADRRHPRKKRRPFAAGTLQVIHGVCAAAALLVTAVALAVLLPPEFAFALASYYALTLGYTFYLKRLVLVDVLILASLYTLRLVAGAAAISLAPSFWLLAFAVFIFMSLALVKRYTELVVQRDAGSLKAHGRGYQIDDFPLLQTMGVTSGYISVLILALYINSEAGKLLYRHIEFLWFLCILELFWISRVWLLAHRGRMHDDPLVFALRDRSSQFLALLALAAIGFAL